MRVAKITRTKKTVVKVVKLPDDLNMAISYLIKNDIDKRKASHFIRMALVNRYTDKVEKINVSKSTLELPDKYFFHIPSALDFRVVPPPRADLVEDESIR